MKKEQDYSERLEEKKEVLREKIRVLATRHINDDSPLTPSEFRRANHDSATKAIFLDQLVCSMLAIEDLRALFLDQSACSMLVIKDLSERLEKLEKNADPRMNDPEERKGE